jgi:hypothetical protein
MSRQIGWGICDDAAVEERVEMCAATLVSTTH